MRRHIRPPVLLSYAGFVLVGITAGVGGVVLLAQIADYGVDRATIGIAFFTGAAGFALAGISTGALIHRFGIRITLASGGGSFVLAGLYLATRPPFVAFVLVQFVVGYATGILESVLNVYLVALPDATTLLNRLHAFFGVGALVGPVLATWIVGFASWTVVWLVLALISVPLLAGFLMAFPRAQPAGPPEPATQASEVAGQASEASAPATGSLLIAALRDSGVLFGAVMLSVYVGLELCVGNWGFSYLTQARALSSSLAGYSVSGYWLGLTLGRFLLSPIAKRIGATEIRLMYACLAGIAAAATLAWLSPVAALASVALVLLGFFLGPIFPTTIAIVPQLADSRLRPTAIGVMNAASTVGGAALPWLAGAIAQSTGIWTLLPFTLALAVLLTAVWRPLAHRIRTLRARGQAGAMSTNRL
jgi:fucose permease